MHALGANFMCALQQGTTPGVDRFNEDGIGRQLAIFGTPDKFSERAVDHLTDLTSGAKLITLEWSLCLELLDPAKGRLMMCSSSQTKV